MPSFYLGRRFSPKKTRRRSIITRLSSTPLTLTDKGFAMKREDNGYNHIWQLRAVSQADPEWRKQCPHISYKVNTLIQDVNSNRDIIIGHQG